MKTARRFVILSSPRSGTHMLRTGLQSHPNIACLAEAFNPDLVGPEPYDTSWSTEDVLEKHIYRRRLSMIHTTGFAVHRGGAPLGPWTDLWDHLLAAPELSVIVLHRHDLVRRYLSFLTMRERNRRSDPSYQPPPRALGIEELRGEFLRYEAELAGFRQKFRDHRRLQVSYEQLRDDFRLTALRLQQFLGVPSHLIEPKTRRNPQHRLGDLVANLTELRAAFQGSRWEWCFREGPPGAADRQGPGGPAQIVRAPASLVRRRGPGPRPRRDILNTATAFYSQGRDELVVRDFFQDRRGCIFVDIGAGHPVNNSRSYYLERHLGWPGVALEADEDLTPIYQALRPMTRLCGDAFMGAGDSGLPLAEKASLSDILVRQGVERIDWMTLGPMVDAPTALAGLDLARFRPHLLHIAPPRGQGDSGQPWRESILELLSDAAYRPVARYRNEAALYFEPNGP